MRKSPLGSIRAIHGHFVTVDDRIERRDVTAAEYNKNDRTHGLSERTIANVWSFGNTANVLRTGFEARGQRPEAGGQKLGAKPLPSDYRLLTCALPKLEFVIKVPLFLWPAPH